MKEEAKKKWGKPKLIILTRGKPEERVLTTCKVSFDIPGEPNNLLEMCVGPADCSGCVTLSGT